MKHILALIKLGLACTLLFFIPCLALAQTSTLQLIPGLATTLTGTGTTGTSLTQVDVPRGVYIDPVGNLFIADTSNQRILKITPGGVVSVYAGKSGTAGYTGDGGPATSAELHGPEDITMDSAGNLYIADSTNNRIRIVNTAGVINTYAGSSTTAGYGGDGGPATSALLNTPWGVALDAAGNLYIADEINDCIRVVNKGTQNISTYAGVCTSSGFAGDGGSPTAAKLNAPKGVYVDAQGDVFICDTANDRIREVKANTSVITTVIGNGSANFNGDGLAATATAVDQPSGMAFDAAYEASGSTPAGAIYFNDSNNRLRRDLNGIITTVAGTGTAAYNTTNTPATLTNINVGPKVAIDAAGNLYVGDSTNERVWKIVGAQTSLTFANQGEGTTSAAQTVSVYNSGALPVALTGLSVTGPYVLGPATTCSNGGSIASGQTCVLSVEFAPTSLGTLTGTVTVSDNLTSQVINLTGVGTLAPVTVNLTLASNLIQLGGSTTATVQVLPPASISTVPTQTVTLTAGGATLTSVTLSNGSATTPSFGATLIPGTYSVVANYSGDSNFLPGSSSPVTLVVNGLTTAISVTTSPASPQILQPVTLTATLTNAAGASAPSGKVTFYDGTTSIGVVNSPFTNGQAALTIVLSYGSHSITAVYSGDNVYNPATSTPAVLSVGSGPVPTFIPGVLTTFAGTTAAGYSGDGGAATAALLNGPYVVTTDRYNNVYIGDCNNDRIRKVTNGIITTIAGTGTAGSSGDGGPATSATLHCPRGLAVDAAGDIFLYDYFNAKVREISAATGFINTVAGNGAIGYMGDGGQAVSAELSEGWGVAVDNAGNLYIADSGNDVVRKVSPNGLISTIAGIASVATSTGDGGPATAATLNDPVKVALDSAGNLYIVESGGNRVRIVNPAGKISTFAGTGAASESGNGGLATAAALDGPYSIAIDGAGDVYIGDREASVIRFVNNAGIIQNYAGAGAAGYTGNGGSALSGEIIAPYAIALDNTGNLYIADTSSTDTENVVREVVANSSVINFGTIVIGNAQPIPLLGNLTNTGTSSLVLTGLALNGSAFTLETGTPNGCTSTTVLAPGASCAYAIGFTYSVAGTFAGTLTFTDNAGDVANSTQTVSLAATVVLPTPVTTLVITPAIFAIPGATVTMTATATPPVTNPNAPAPSTPTGTVTFTANGTAIGTAPLVNGVATFTTSTLALGTYSVIASYGGSSMYQPSASAAQTYTISYDFALAVTPSSANVINTSSLSGTITLTPAVGLTVPIVLSCNNLPYGYTCVFGSPTFTSDGSGTPFSTSLTFQYTGTTGWLRRHSDITVCGLILFGLVGFTRRRRSFSLMLPTACLLVISFGLSGCGKPITSATQAAYPVSVTATAGVVVHTVLVNMNLEKQ